MTGALRLDLSSKDLIALALKVCANPIAQTKNVLLLKLVMTAT